MNDKQLVSLEKKVCMVCIKKYNSEEVLEGQTATSWGLCPEHEKLHKNGYICIIAIDLNKSKNIIDEMTYPNDVYRTGRIVYVHRPFLKKVMDIPSKSIELPVIFGVDELVDQLEDLYDSIGNIPQ